MALPTHPLGNSGLHITRVGFGSWAGARTPNQADGWIGAAAIKLTRPDLDEVAEAIRCSGAGTGPIKSRESRALNREAA
jgi:aryl-alcohol dehydrogenase-like predicted oxidoreductase